MTRASANKYHFACKPTQVGTPTGEANTEDAKEDD